MNAPMMPSRPEMPSPGSRPNATALGVLAIVGIAGIFLLLVGSVTFGILFIGIMGVGLGVMGLAAFHYLVWGWWMNQVRDQELRDNPDVQPFWKTNLPPPSESPLGPHGL